MTLTRRTFFKHVSLSTLALITPHLNAGLGSAGKLIRSHPSAVGVSSTALLAFLDALAEAKFELHSLMILRRGQVIAEGWWEPYGPEFVHTMYSMSKSFTSTAVGFAVAEGKLTVEDKVVSFFPDDVPDEISDNLAAMRVKDLLTMSTGHEKEPTQTVVKEENWVRTFLAQNIAHPPGTVFMYNSAATYMCSAIVQKVTGQTILEYLTSRLFTPLGITGMKWETCPRGINTGGWGLSVQTEALAKFGQWLLQKGKWQERQLLPAAWIEEASRFHIQQPGEDKPDRPKSKNDWLQGYGYQFWRCQHGYFRGDGAFGQFTIVLPEHDAVIVMTSENKNMQGQLDLVWKHLLPAFESSTPAHDEALAARLKSLRLLPPSGATVGGDVTPLEGKRFHFEANDLGLTEAVFRVESNRLVFEAKTNQGAHAITCGWASWQLGETAFPGTPPRLISGGKPRLQPLSKLAASAAWIDAQTLVMTWRYIETPHHDTVTCRFEGDEVSIRFVSSIAAMSAKPHDARAPLKGRVVI